MSVRVEPELDQFDELELKHFVDVEPDDCLVEGCRVHSEETMKRLLGGDEPGGSEG